MKTSKIIAICILLLGFCFSWLIAESANIFNSSPWYLEYFPSWVDRIIYSTAHFLLAEDLSLAAKQMDFIETFILTLLILSAFNIIIITLLNKYLFRDNDTDQA